jgi:hypothetical protein
VNKIRLLKLTAKPAVCNPGFQKLFLATSPFPSPKERDNKAFLKT